jgi:hypothetical protein
MVTGSHRGVAQSSDILGHNTVLAGEVTDVSEECSASIFTVQQPPRTV